MQKLYNVGIYTRLSTDDAYNSQKKKFTPADESVSIENQKRLLSKFVMLSGWIETKVYVDDGYSGGNFQRPGFQQMLADAKAGVINLILVKDLSRLGRDYVEVGRYTDVVFPSLGCRFVSLLDEIDSENDDNLMLPIRALMNDYHLRELSGKIKAVLHAKVKKGQFLSAYAPYGYRKNPEDTHRLIIDEYAAGIVRRIFALRLDGHGYAKIAGILNTDGIQTPQEYWREQNGKPTDKKTLWMYATVKELLKNEIYIGHLTQHHTGTLSYKNKTQIKKPEAEWVRHENSHEPVIDLPTWEKAQKINRAATEKHKHARKPEPALFTAKLFCLGCGSPMRTDCTVQHHKNGDIVRYPRYNCSRHSQSGRTTCSPHTISEKILKTLILAELKAYSQAVTLDESAILARVKRRMDVDDTGRQNLLRQEIKTLERRVAALERIAADLYEDKATGKISEATFFTLVGKNEQERQEKQARYEEAQRRLAAIQEKNLNISKWAEVVRKHIRTEDVSRADIEELIERIEIGESDYAIGTRRQEVKIYWRFVGCVEG